MSVKRFVSLEDFSALAEPANETAAIVFDETDHFDTIEHMVEGGAFANEVITTMGSALEALRKQSVPGTPARLISARERVRRARRRA